MPKNRLIDEFAPSGVRHEFSDDNLRRDVLDMIEQSGLKDFNGDGLAWGQWCRDMATAANSGDAAWVGRLIAIRLRAMRHGIN